MKESEVEIIWPNGYRCIAKSGETWLTIAEKSGFVIPTGCLSGSCGACEIDVNGETLRACIEVIPNAKSLKVDIISDPYW